MFSAVHIMRLLLNQILRSRQKLRKTKNNVDDSKYRSNQSQVRDASSSNYVDDNVSHGNGLFVFPYHPS